MKDDKKVLILRNCAADMSAHGGFKWPESGDVSAPDWNHEPVCGGGLHGLLWGQGDFSNFNKSHDAKWLVVEVLESEIVKLDNKVKFPRGRVVYCGNWPEAFTFIRNARPKSEKFESSTTGDYGHASTTGYYGHASATGKYGHASTTGIYGHASATGKYGHASTTGIYGHASTTGYSGHASTTGDYGHASTTGIYGYASTTGIYGHASATGDYGHASTTGIYGHASATGKYGHASTTGDYGHASTTGIYGHASATGDYGHASATGDYGIAACLGQDGTVMAGNNGAIVATYWDGNRNRIVVGYVGEGIKEKTKYRLNKLHEFEEVK